MSLETIINSTASSAIDEANQNGTLEWIMAKIDQFPIKLSFIFACAMVIGSVVPYVPQYFTIKQTQNTEGFSLYVCLTLLIANILRIMFWFGKHFETALLIQSIVMIFAMFILLELCVRVKNSNLIIQQKRRYFSYSKTSEQTENKKLKTSKVKDEEETKILTSSLKRSRSLDDCLNDVNNDVQPKHCSAKNQQIKSSNTLPINKKQPKASPNNSPTTTIEMNNCAHDNNEDKEKESQNPISLDLEQQSHSTITQQEPKSINDDDDNVSKIELNQRRASISSTSSQKHANSPPAPKEQINKSNAGNQQLPTPKQTIVSTNPEDGHTTVVLEDENLKIPSVEDQLMEKDGDKKQSIPVDSSANNNNAASDQTSKPKMSEEEFKKRRFIDFDLRYFWEWTDFMSYLECMAIFTLLAGLLFYFFIHVPWVVEGYGLVALVSESLLASPQFFRNLKVKSTEGMSKLMVFTWFLGDLYKTIYFFVREAPFQFLICGCTQITFDTLIFLQIIFYKKKTYRKLSKSKHLERPRQDLNDQSSGTPNKPSPATSSKSIVKTIIDGLQDQNNNNNNVHESIKLHKLS